MNIECPICKQQVWVDFDDDVIVMCGRYSHITEREIKGYMRNETKTD